MTFDDAIIVAVSVVVFLVISFHLNKLIFTNKELLSEEKLVIENKKKLRKYKRMADFAEKFSVGSWIIGLFQLNAGAILLATGSLSYLVLIELIIDDHEV